MKKIPLVQCAEHLEHSGASYVSIDDVSASKTVVKNILSKGKDKIALINGPLMYKYARKRKEGYLLALEEAGIEPTPSYIVELPVFSYGTAFSMATQMLSMEDRPNGIFAVSDVFAVAAMKAATSLNLRIPEDVGIVGFDNTVFSIMCDPPLTTVKQPQYQMGFLACEMLIEQINDKNTATKQLLLEVELIMRKTL
jgi:DNA-binding LacI/PurR family transcriptional regulator